MRRGERAHAGLEERRERVRGPGPVLAFRARAVALRDRAAGLGARRTLFVGALGLAAGIAFVALRRPLVSGFPYFVDEGILARYVEWGTVPGRRFDALGEAIRPGAIWVGVAAMEATGTGALTALRLVGIAAGLVTLAAGTVLAHRLGGYVAAAAFALAAVVSPFLMLHGPLASRDAIVAAAAVTALVLQLDLARRPRWSVALLLGLALGAGLLTKESGQGAIWLLPLSLVAFRWREPLMRRRLARWAGGVTLALGIVFLTELALRLSGRWAEYAELLDEQAVTRPVADAVRDPIGLWQQQWPATEEALIAYVTPPVLALAAFGLVQGLRLRSAAAGLTAAWAAAHLGSVLFLGGLDPWPRYLAPGVVFVLVLAAYGFAEVVRLLARAPAPRPLRGVAVALVACVALIPSLLFDARLLSSPARAPYASLDREQYVTGWSSGYGLPQIADCLGRVSGGERTTIAAVDETFHHALYMLVGGHPIVFADLARETLDETPWVLLNGRAAPEGVEPLEPVCVFRRPQGGTTIGVYRAGLGG